MENIKYTQLTGHQKRKVEDMEEALNLGRSKDEQVTIVAVEK